MVVDSKQERQQTTLAIRWAIRCSGLSSANSFPVAWSLEISITTSVDHCQPRKTELQLGRRDTGTSSPCPGWHGGAHGRMGREAGLAQGGEKQEKCAFCFDRRDCNCFRGTRAQSHEADSVDGVGMKQLHQWSIFDGSGNECG